MEKLTIEDMPSSVANRVIEFTPNGIIDRRTSFDEYFTDPVIKKKRDEMYCCHQRPVL